MLTMAVAATGANAAPPSRILILPFAIHAEKDLSFLNNGIQSMLGARLTHEGRSQVVRHDQTAGDEAEAVRLAAAQGADYVVFGSLTLFGNSVSTDGVLIDVATGQVRVRYSESGGDSGDVIRHIDRLAQQINQDVFGLGPKTYGAPAAPAPQATASMPAVGSVPAAVAAPGAAPPGAVVPAIAGAAVSAAAGPQVWKSHRLSAALCGLAAGDVDGDGQNEVVVVDTENLYAYRRSGDGLTQLAIYKADRGDRIFGVDAADINRNNRAEIYITAIDPSGQLASFVLEWDGSRLRRIARDLNWYFRVIAAEDGGQRLVGQKRGMAKTAGVAELENENRLFQSAVVELSWRGDRLEPGARIPLPDGMNVFGFTQAAAMNDGRPLLAGFDDKNHLVILGENGRREYKSSESFGGSLNYLEYNSSSQFSQADRYYLPLRLHVADIDGDGQNEIVTARNRDATGNLLSRFRQFAHGQVVALAWDKIGMKEKWATEAMADFVVDTALADVDGDGRPEVVFAVSTRGGFLEKAESYIVTYRP